MIQNWGEITLNALLRGWEAFLLFVPKLIGALVVFLIGWFFSVGVGKLVTEILRKAKMDRIFEKSGWKEALERAEIKTTFSEFIGAIFKWILVILFLSAAVEILGLIEFANLLNRIITWLPNLIVAVAIFVVAVILTEILEKLIKASAKKMEISYVGVLGQIIKVAIYVFAGLLILNQLGVGKDIVNALVYGIIGTLALSLGLAFGLGGKDAAAKLIEDIKRKIEEK